MNRTMWVLALVVCLAGSTSVAALEIGGEVVPVPPGAFGSAMLRGAAESFWAWEMVMHGTVIAAIVTGAYLEYTTNCAGRGLENYRGQRTAAGNRGYLVGGGGLAMEEHVKWEARESGWLQRKCQ